VDTKSERKIDWKKRRNLSVLYRFAINLRRDIAEESGDWNSIPSEQYSGV
jgi:hypothetical protein